MIQDMDEGQPCLSCGEKCPGYGLHSWRKTCQYCKCTRETHDVGRDDGFYAPGSYLSVWEQLMSRKDPFGLSSANRKKRAVKLGYAWVPTGLSKEKVDEYMSQFETDKVPRLGTAGEKRRILQLIVQLPKSDLSVDRCRNLKTTDQKRDFENFCRSRDVDSMDVGQVKECSKAGMVCRKCDGSFATGSLIVFSPKAGEDVAWHAVCFVCCVCQEPLVDLIHCTTTTTGDDEDGAGVLVYCERHFAQSNRPRCFACDELIFSSKYFKAMNRDWHEGHFACFQCDLSLSGQRYIKSSSDQQPYCVKCYETLFANVCAECKTVIGTGNKDLSYKDQHWHEKCFLCVECRCSLSGAEFASVDNRLFCAECHDNKFAARCDACEQVFRAGMKKYEFEGKKWHEACFKCGSCHELIMDKSFIPRDGTIYCEPCFAKNFGHRCKKCNEVISKGGVTFKETPWHKECFTCTQCAKNLAGEKFTSHDEKPFCVDCYGQLFAKKCHRCSAVITGAGKTKFVTCDDQHWHTDCFKCRRCQKSLVGQGFLMEEGDIVCAQCSV